jgi:hypothetical protein
LVLDADLRQLRDAMGGDGDRDRIIGVVLAPVAD